MSTSSTPVTPPSTPAPTTPAPVPAASVVVAAQAALAGEHACVFGYGVVGAHLRGGEERAAREALARHRSRRDDLSAHIRALGAEPVAALASYALPFPVGDAAGARELAGLLEQRLVGLYVDLVGAGPEVDLREVAARSAVDAASRATRWSATATAFPGLDGRIEVPEPTASASS
jgi:hypothetical protein